MSKTLRDEDAIGYVKWAASGAALFQRCTRRQYMAILLTPGGRVVGTGRNGAPAGLPNCTDGGCPRGQTKPGAVAHGSSYGPGEGQCVAVHAEVNAFLYADRSAYAGGTLVVNGPPCWNCAVVIAGSGVDAVAFRDDPEYAEWPTVREFLLQKVSLYEVDLVEETVVFTWANGKRPPLGIGFDFGGSRGGCTVWRGF